MPSFGVAAVAATAPGSRHAGRNRTPVARGGDPSAAGKWAGTGSARRSGRRPGPSPRGSFRALPGPPAEAVPFGSGSPAHSGSGVRESGRRLRRAAGARGARPGRGASPGRGAASPAPARHPARSDRARARPPRGAPSHAHEPGEGRAPDGGVRLRPARRIRRDARARAGPPGARGGRGRTGVHPASAARAPLVGRPPLHRRGLPVLVGGHREPRGALTVRPAARAARGRAAPPRFEVLDETTVRYYVGRRPTRSFSLRSRALAPPTSTPPRTGFAGSTPATGTGSGSTGRRASAGGAPGPRSTTARTRPTATSTSRRRPSSRGAT